MNREELEAKTKVELIGMANEKFELRVDNRQNKDELVQLILNAHNRKAASTVTVDADEEGRYPVGPDEYLIELQGGKWGTPNGQVPIGVNGKIDTVPIGVPVVVKAHHMEVLKNANVGSWEPLKDNQDRISWVWRENKRYPFSIHYHNKTDRTVKVEV